MALPNLTDLVLYVNKKLTGADWNTNWQKIVNWFTSGKTDIKVKSIELAQDGGIINNGSLTQSGDLTVDGNIAATGNLNVDGVISGDGSGLTGVVSAAQVSYTPFCVNSGFVNSNGNAGLFHYTAGVSTSIEFKVDDGTSYKPITFTNAKGKTTTLEAINSYDLSQTDNGTYLVYLTENATAVTLSDNGAKVYYQPTAPTSPSATDIWLDTSKEGLTSYIRESGTWVETNLVVLGSVTVNNYKIQSAKSYPYNQNGYNINSLSSIFGMTKYAIDSQVSASRNTAYGPFNYPVIVVVGRSGSYIQGEYWWLEVSTDGSNWNKVMGFDINNDAKAMNIQSIILDRNVYFRAIATTSGTITTYWYAPIWEKY